MQQEVEYGQTGIMAIHGRALSVLSCERNSDIAIELGSVMTEPGYSSVGLSSGGDGRNTDSGSFPVSGKIASAGLPHYTVEGINGNNINLGGILCQYCQLDALFICFQAGRHGVFKDVSDHAAHIDVGHRIEPGQPYPDGKAD